MPLKYKIIRWYLYVLPFYLLSSIVFSAFRTTASLQFASYYLGLLQGFDIVLFLCYAQYIIGSKEFIYTSILLLPAFIIGFLSSEFNRNFFTDISNPILFFSKCVIFSVYWRRFSFVEFYTSFARYAFIGSLILLPFIYLIFMSSGVNRLAIFPPIELSYAVFGISGKYFLVAITLLVILLYGKRAQLLGALICLLLLMKKVSLKNRAILLIIGTIVFFFIVKYLEENIAYQRLVSSINMLIDSSSSNIDLITAGRFSEFELVIKNMSTSSDYIFGKGCGIQLELGDKIISNIHFTPLSLIMKYGIFFMIFVYLYLIKYLFYRNRNSSNEYKIAHMILLFFFIESFFSYAIFVESLLPIILGFLRTSSK